MSPKGVVEIGCGKKQHKTVVEHHHTPVVEHHHTPVVTPIIISKDNLKDTIKDTQKTGESVLLTEKEKQDVFAELWYKYPNKDGSKEAWAAFQKSVITAQDVIDIKKAFENYQTTREYKNGYFKSGEKWFGRWRDFIANALPNQDPAAKWRTEKR